MDPIFLKMRKKDHCQGSPKHVIPSQGRRINRDLILKIFKFRHRMFQIRRFNIQTSSLTRLRQSGSLFPYQIQRVVHHRFKWSDGHADFPDEFRRRR